MIHARSDAARSDSSTLVIGHGGLLGSAVCRALRAHGVDPVTPCVRWNTPAGDLDLAEAFRRVAGAGDPWRVFWCAGTGVPSTPKAAFDSEMLTFRRFLDVIAKSDCSDGSLFFASSAGAVYAGSFDPPFTERTPERPLTPYGRTKLEHEELASDLTAAGVRVAIGRISNLYGPGQRLDKAQGLVSQLCLSVLAGRPLGIYVPLDTLRDYVFVDDAAAMILDMSAEAATLPAGAPATTKILASGRSVSIASILGEFRHVMKRRPPVVLAASPLRKIQARDLRMRSVVWPWLDKRQFTPLAVGIDACLRDVGLRWRAELT